MDLRRVARTKMSHHEGSDSGGGQATFPMEQLSSMISTVIMATQQQQHQERQRT